MKLDDMVVACSACDRYGKRIENISRKSWSEETVCKDEVYVYVE